MGGPGREINIHYLQEIAMGFVCLELVPMKEPPNPLHPQPPSYGSLAIVLMYF